jgi:hypothetical protein
LKAGLQSGAFRHKSADRNYVRKPGSTWPLSDFINAV